MAGGAVTDDTRSRAAVPTSTESSDKGAVVSVLAHFGRPKGQPSAEFSSKQVVAPLAHVSGRPVKYVDWEGDKATVSASQPGDIAVSENTRFFGGEEKNDPAVVERFASLGDLYVNDAFSAAHRAHASTEGSAHVLPAFAGRAMQAELEASEKASGNPQSPVAAVVGGAKVSTKLDVSKHLVTKVDHLIIGGGMANTFLAARGVDDVVVSKEFAANPPSSRTCNVHEVAADEMILDVGPAAVEALADVLKTCRPSVWNGPSGAFETEPFDAATVASAKTAAPSTRAGSSISV
ncbi:hypothetical protein OY671_008044, partial [Metschnikowia pulcherrima]